MSPYAALLVAAFLGVVVAGHRGGDFGKCHANLTVSVDECCAIPQLANVSVLNKCRKEHPIKPFEDGNGGKRGKDKRHAGSCLANCVLTAMGALKGEEIDTAAFKKAVQKVSQSNPTFAPLIAQAVDECGASARLDPGFVRDPDNKPECGPIPKVFVNCVYKTLFEKCPSSVWTDRKECAALKDKLQQGCPYFALRKHPKKIDN